MSADPLQANLDSSWQELLALSKTQAPYNFGAPQLLESELEIFTLRIEAAKASSDLNEIQLCIAQAEGLAKHLKSLIQQSELLM